MTTSLSSRYMPTAGGGVQPFMSWLKNGEYRYPSSFDADEQVKELRKIVGIEDLKSREIAAGLFDKARYMQQCLDDHKKEMIELFSVINKYETEMLEKKAAEK